MIGAWCANTARWANCCISWAMRSHSGTAGAGFTCSSWAAKAAVLSSCSSGPPSRGKAQVLRLGGRLPVRAWKRSCTSGWASQASKVSASAWRAERRNTTRLDPPAVDAPGPAVGRHLGAGVGPVLARPGPGSGAVAQSARRARPNRRSSSPMFQGPPMKAANAPRPNSCHRLAIWLLVSAGAWPLLKRSRKNPSARWKPALRKLPQRLPSRSSGSSCCRASASSGSNSFSGSSSGWAMPLACNASSACTKPAQVVGMLGMPARANKSRR